MKMIRTVYHFDGKDYQENEVVEFSFFLPRNSIQSFREVCNIKSCRHIISKDFQSDNTKRITVRTFPSRLVDLCQYLGKKDWDEVRNVWTVTNSFLRHERHTKKYYGYMCYNPQTHTTELKTNSPFVIKGNQQIFHGKLWRRIINTKEL